MHLFKIEGQEYLTKGYGPHGSGRVRLKAQIA